MKLTIGRIARRALAAIGLAAAAAASTPSLSEAMPRTMPVAEPAADGVTPVVVRRGFYAVRGVYYYNGHRGVAVARTGWRYHRGYWFPPAAFAGTVVVAPAPRTVVVAPAPAARLTAAHLRWCRAQYVSYRAYDNSYQPVEGRRRQCWSPYS